MRDAYLILEDGTVFCGEGFAAEKEAVFELVFATGMVGYTEELSDPSLIGQGVVLTYPLIGNCGICIEDCESEKSWISALIIRELCTLASNFRMEMTLEDYLQKNGVPGIQGIDTRALTRILRSKGTMNGMLTYDIGNTNERLSQALERINAYEQTGLARKVSRPTRKICDGNKKIAVIDVGAKDAVYKQLQKRGAGVMSFNCETAANEILAFKPDGIVFSNGPGDPSECPEVVETAKILLSSGLPVFGICLGHQIMACATGCKTKKMVFGHRGGNQPVKDNKSGRVLITAQNHGYVLDESTIDPNVAEISYYNVNDGSVEGLRYKNKNAFSVQFHPEACAGPKDMEFLFDEFLGMLGE